MPREGWKNINLREEPYLLIEKLLRDTNDSRNPTNVVSDLVSDAINSIQEEMPKNPLRTINQFRLGMSKSLISVNPKFNPKDLILEINELSSQNIINSSERALLLDFISQIVDLERQIHLKIDDANKKRRK